MVLYGSKGGCRGGSRRDFRPCVSVIEVLGLHGNILGKEGRRADESTCSRSCLYGSLV